MDVEFEDASGNKIKRRGQAGVIARKRIIIPLCSRTMTPELIERGMTAREYTRAFLNGCASSGSVP